MLLDDFTLKTIKISIKFERKEASIDRVKTIVIDSLPFNTSFVQIFLFLSQNELAGEVERFIINISSS
jgi:hypothetical protein